MTAGVQLHGVTQSAGAPALPPSAKPEVSAEQRACGAPVCVCRGERNLSIAGRRKGGHHYGWISKKKHPKLYEAALSVACVTQNTLFPQIVSLETILF